MLFIFSKMCEENAGCSPRRSHCKKDLVCTIKQVAHKLPGTKVRLFSPKEFQNLCSKKMVFIATDNITVVAYINKE